ESQGDTEGRKEWRPKRGVRPEGKLNRVGVRREVEAEKRWEARGSREAEKGWEAK
ncbi:unnamed protein product, partial [Bubo scandiacus]